VVKQEGSGAGRALIKRENVAQKASCFLSRESR
jgi:hypothetical protein